MKNENNNNDNNSNSNGDKSTNVSGLINNISDVIIDNNQQNSNNNQQQNTNQQNSSQQSSNQQSSNEQKDNKGDNKSNSSNNEDNNENLNLQEVEIDGVVHKLDKEGNAIDNEGKIVMSKEDIKKQAEEQSKTGNNNNSDNPLINDIIEKTGIVIKDENGEVKKYEDSIEGIKEYTEDVAEELAYKKVTSWFEERPEVERYAQFLEQGGKPEDFFKRKIESVKSINFDEKDTNLLKSLITRDLINSGFSKEDAELTTQMYEDTNKLKDFGKKAFEKLKAYEENLELEEKKNYENYQKQEQEKIKNHWNNVNDIISKGKLANVNIPDTDKKGFFEWLAVSVDNEGNSQAAIARSKATTQQLLELDYLIYKGFDLSKLVQQEVKQQKVNSLRLRLTNKGGLNNGEGIDRSKYSNPNEIDISLKSILNGGQ